MINLNYVWIGPSPSKPGMDTDGPLKMCECIQKFGRPNVKINFWCLDRYQENYQRKFSNYASFVRIIPIIKYLEFNNTLGFEKSQEIIRIYSKLNLFDPIYDIPKLTDLTRLTRIKRSIVFKDLISLYCLYSEGGYYLDTNVFP
ncbi:MAG: hypothetical protein K2X39_10450, partial [Silvanigrellaceae bacterium]|nr:hypothetical protein [Silvanigrellaceae bacterium]